MINLSESDMTGSCKVFKERNCWALLRRTAEGGVEAALSEFLRQRSPHSSLPGSQG